MESKKSKIALWIYICIVIGGTFVLLALIAYRDSDKQIKKSFSGLQHGQNMYITNAGVYDIIEKAKDSVVFCDKKYEVRKYVIAKGLKMKADLYGVDDTLMMSFEKTSLETLPEYWAINITKK